MRKRFLLKALLCVIGIFVLIYIAVTFHYKKIQDGNAPYIESEVVKAELAAMSDALENRVYDSLLDEGNNFKEEYLNRNASEVKIMTLLDKPSRRVVDIDVDYIGFTIEDKVVVGYGLDDCDKLRELPYIGYIEQ